MLFHYPQVLFRHMQHTMGGDHAFYYAYKQVVLNGPDKPGFLKEGEPKRCLKKKLKRSVLHWTKQA